jgi:hypothetical protein
VGCSGGVVRPLGCDDDDNDDDDDSGSASGSGGVAERPMCGVCSDEAAVASAAVATPAAGAPTAGLGALLEAPLASLQGGRIETEDVRASAQRRRAAHVRERFVGELMKGVDMSNFP